MFFGEGDKSMSSKMVAQAGMICSECPVFRECLTSALTYEEQYGVWAGTSGRIRRRIQRMLSDGTVTVAEVVEDYINGNRTRYERPDLVVSSS